MVITIIGIGLIGGSMALALKEMGIAKKIIAVDANEAHQHKALVLALADEPKSISEAVAEADFIIVASPVNAAEVLLPEILDSVSKQVVMDVGSTKEGIIAAVKDHPDRSRFVATHPMWG